MCISCANLSTQQKYHFEERSEKSESQYNKTE